MAAKDTAAAGDTPAPSPQVRVVLAGSGLLGLRALDQLAALIASGEVIRLATAQDIAIGDGAQ